MKTDAVVLDLSEALSCGIRNLGAPAIQRFLQELDGASQAGDEFSWLLFFH